MGELSVLPGVRSPFTIVSRNGTSTSVRDGAINAAGNVVGTIIHGLLEHAGLRAFLLASLRQQRGLAHPDGATPIPSASEEYDRLEATVRQSLDLSLLRRLAQVG
jgi:adenosylcobyric acid synthase